MPYTNETDAISLHLLQPAQLKDYLNTTDAMERQWIERHQFRAGADESLCIPDAQGGIAKVLVGYRKDDPIAALGNLAHRLPAGSYRLATPVEPAEEQLLLLGWGLGAYRFSRYKTRGAELARIHLPESQRHAVQSLLDAQTLVRDLINTPALDLGPAELAAAAQDLGQQYGAQTEIIDGERLENEYPAIHAVGMGSTRGPRLVVMQWGQPEHPTLCVVGKGVVFDTGGLNMKNGSRMLRMKKDMGGAAHALGLARLIMDNALPVRLILLIPVVENMVSGHSYRPGDVIQTRRGLTVEITNTDAEGRIILADALQRASEEKPDLIIDYATLTGAARIALGPDLAPVFSNTENLVQTLRECGEHHADPVWHMPLPAVYQRFLESDIADLLNCPPSSFAGAINAALFLQYFVDTQIPWMHLDVYGWNDGNRPGRPQGGEAHGLRAMYYLLRLRYAK